MVFFVLRDQAFNEADLEAPDLARLVCRPASRTSGSGIGWRRGREFAISPRTVDASTGPVSVNLTARLTDDMTGHELTELRFQSPLMSSMFGALFDSGDLVSGTTTDGVFETTVRVPAGAADHLEAGVSADSGPGWERAREQCCRPQRRRPAGQFHQHRPGRRGRAQLGRLPTRPETIDTATGPATVKLTARLTDDMTGHELTELRFQSPSILDVGASFDSGYLASGHHGRRGFETTVRVPAGAAHGTWKLAWLLTRDQAGNEREYGAADLSSAGSC